jgi:hypothetical protein
VSNVLDITLFKQKNDMLKAAIALAVADTQSLVMRELPNVLRMTTDQFDMLKTDPAVLSSTAGEYLYMTPLNVMEMEIK